VAFDCEIGAGPQGATELYASTPSPIFLEKIFVFSDLGKGSAGKIVTAKEFFANSGESVS